MDERDLSRFCCLNRDGSDHGTRGHGNRTVTARYGPRRTRLLRGRTCPARFSERKGTPRSTPACRPPNPTVALPAGLTYATVHKQRANGRVAAVGTTPVFGRWAGLLLAGLVAAVSRVVNAAFVERHNGTDRGGAAARGGRRPPSRRTGPRTWRRRGSATSRATSAGQCGPCG